MRGVSRRLLLPAAAVALALLQGGPAWGWICPPVIDGIWRAGHRTAQGQLTAAVDGLGASVSAQQAVNAQLLTSIVAVLAKQTALDGDRQSAAARAAAQGYAAVATEIQRREALRRTIEDYGPAGRALSGCETAARAAAFGAAVSGLDGQVAGLLARDRIDSVRAGASPADAARLRLQPWTEDETAAGLGDPRLSGDAKDRIVATIAGAPLPPGSDLGATAAAAAAVDAVRLRALRGPLVRALTAVRAISSSPDGSPTLADGLDWIIGRYGTGPANRDWRMGLQTLGARGQEQEEARLDAVLLDLSRLETRIDGLEDATLAAALAAAVR